MRGKTMKKTQKKGTPNSKLLFVGLWFLSLVLSLLCVSATGYADVGDIFSRFQPYINVTETYDSNVDMTPNNEKDDFITAVTLGLRFSTRPRSETTRAIRRSSATEEEPYGIDLDFQATPTFYAKEKDNNYLGLSGSLETWYTWDRSLTFRVRDTLLRSDEPLERSYAPDALPGDTLLGRQTGRSIYYRNVFEPSLEYRFGRENSFLVNYRNNVYRSDAPSSENSQENYISPTLNYWFDIQNGITLQYALDLGNFERSSDFTGNMALGRYTHRLNRRTSIFGEYEFLKRDFDPQTVESVNYQVHTPAVGFEHAFSPTLSVMARIGYFWETQKTGSGEKGISSSLLITQRSQRTTYTLSLERGFTEDYFSADNLGFATYYGVIGTITHQLTQEATVTFSGSYRRPEYNDGQIDNLWTVGGGPSYQLFRWLNLGLDLSYSQNDSNRVSSEYKDYRGMFRITAAY
jgi:hypothetical protein